MIFFVFTVTFFIGFSIEVHFFLVIYSYFKTMEMCYVDILIPAVRRYPAENQNILRLAEGAQTPCNTESIDTLRDVGTRDESAREIGEKYSQLPPQTSDVETKWTLFRSGVSAAAARVFGEKRIGVAPRSRVPISLIPANSLTPKPNACAHEADGRNRSGLGMPQDLVPSRPFRSGLSWIACGDSPSADETISFVMPLSNEDRRSAVISLHEAGKSPTEIFRLLQNNGYNRNFIKRTIQRNAVDMSRGYTGRLEFQEYVSEETYKNLLISSMVTIPAILIVDSLLIHGVRKGKRKLMIPWLALELLALIVVIIIIVVFFIILIGFLITTKNGLFFIIFIVVAVVFIIAYSIAVHFFLVVYSHFKELQNLEHAGEEQRTDGKQENFNAEIVSYRSQEQEV
ncbi:unnamed protein product [Darwinula stevensoni]|uniref:Uncharacterized protein n=1 Tax=Darwinula stevensoni TaxID=69355 RepID=A0A7R9AB60_9CRUS|nr:unnamed protein product [Darwinula stevensoni]CAG0898765.1 unnamed protein product [Darwinula stevensoni]